MTGIDNIAIIGAGGIGSHFCGILSRMINARQLGPLSHESFTVYDFDVVEPENLKHQDFGFSEVGVPKAAVMTIRYGFKHRIVRFGKDHLSEVGAFIICADNPGVRRIVFQHAKATKKPFVDMRAEGDMYAVFTDKAPLNVLIASLGDEPETETGVSCQRAIDRRRGVVQMGNFFAAPMGMDILLRQLRKVSYPAKIVRAII
jgi:hypothetical protein